MPTTMIVTNQTPNDQCLEFVPFGAVNSSTTDPLNPTLVVNSDNSVQMCLSGVDNISCDGAPPSIDLQMISRVTNFDLKIGGQLYTTSKTLSQLMIQTNADARCPIQILPTMANGPWQPFGVVIMPPANYGNIMFALRYIVQTRLNPIDSVFVFDGNATNIININTIPQVFARINDWLASNQIPAEFKIVSTSGTQGDGIAVTLAIRTKSPNFGTLHVSNAFSDALNISADNLYLLNATWDANWSLNVVGSTSTTDYTHAYPFNYMLGTRNIANTAGDNSLSGGIATDAHVILTQFDVVNGPLIQDVTYVQNVNFQVPEAPAYPDTVTVTDKAFDLKVSPVGGLIAAAIKLTMPSTATTGYLQATTQQPVQVPLWSGSPLYSVLDGMLYSDIFNVGLNVISEDATLLSSGISPTLKINNRNMTIGIVSTRQNMSMADTPYFFRYVDSADIPTWITRSATIPPFTLTSEATSGPYFTSSSFFAIDVPSGINVLNVLGSGSAGAIWINTYSSIDALMANNPDYQTLVTTVNNPQQNLAVIAGQRVYVVAVTNANSNGGVFLSFTGQQ